MSLQQDAISGILKSGLLSDPLQVAALQEKLAALAVGSGGISVPMPPINVTQVFLFIMSGEEKPDLDSSFLLHW
jgi:hypothetical protein